MPWLGRLYTRLLDRLFGHCALYDAVTWRTMLLAAGCELQECRGIVSPGMVAHWDRGLPVAALARCLSGNAP